MSPMKRPTSPRAARPLSPRLMEQTAASATRQAQRPVVPPLRGVGMGSTYNEAAGPAAAQAASGAPLDDVRAKMMEAVQLRAEMRKQRILERVAAAKEATPASTSQAAFKDPSEQWVDYVEKCAHVSGKWDANRRANTAEALTRAHKTANRIFPERGGDGAPEAMFVDSHGRWVGAEVETKLDGAAGASSASMWRAKREIATDVPLAPKAHGSASVGDLAMGFSEGAYKTENGRRTSTGTAGAPSEKLAKQAREAHGMAAADNADGIFAGRAVEAAGQQLQQQHHQLLERVGEGGRIAGLTSGDVHLLNHARRSKSPAPTRAQLAAHAAGSCGMTSDQVNRQAVDVRLEVGTCAVPSKTAAAKDIGVEAGRVLSGTEGAGAEIASAAPARHFEGAAGMNSAQMRRVKTETERRHCSPLLGHGERDIGASATASLVAPTATVLSAATANAEQYAGARSSHLNRPSTAFEARHLWSETVPKGGFGAKAAATPSGAGLTSGQLGRGSAGFDGGEQQQRPMLRKVDRTGSPIAGGAGMRSADLAAASHDLYFEIDKRHKTEKRHDSSAGAAGASSKAIGDRAVPALALDVSDVPKGASVPRLDLPPSKAPLGDITAAACNSPAKRGPLLKSTAAAEKSAGVSSTVAAKREAQKDHLADQPSSRTRLNPWQTSAVTGVAATVFGAESAVTGVVARVPVPAEGRIGMLSAEIALGRLPSRSAHEHHLQGHAGSKSRAASEPRRRVSADGANAFALIFPTEAMAGGIAVAASHHESAMAAATRAALWDAARSRAGAEAGSCEASFEPRAVAPSAGATSTHLAGGARESRRHSGGARPGFISSLGGFMTGPMIADWHTTPSAAAKEHIAAATGNSLKVYDYTGRAHEPRAISPARGFRDGSPMAARMEQRIANPSPAMPMRAEPAGTLVPQLPLATMGSPAACRAGGKGGGQYSPHRNAAQSTRPW